jgi:hypothetical protein
LIENYFRTGETLTKKSPAAQKETAAFKNRHQILREKYKTNVNA